MPKQLWSLTIILGFSEIRHYRSALQGLHPAKQTKQRGHYPRHAKRQRDKM